MDGVFFEQLGLEAPDVNLGVGSASHGAQMGRMLERIEAGLLESGANARATCMTLLSDGS